MWICICDWMQNASGDKQIWLGDEQRVRQDEEKKSKTIWIKPFNQTRPTHKTISICKTHISESVQDLQARIKDKSKLAELYKISNPVAAFCVRVTSRYLKFNFWTKFGSNKNTHGIYSSVRQTCAAHSITHLQHSHLHSQHLNISKVDSRLLPRWYTAAGRTVKH